MCSRRWPLWLETLRERTQGGVNLGCTGRDSALCGWVVGPCCARLAQPCFWHFVGQRALEHLLGWEREGYANCTLVAAEAAKKGEGTLLPFNGRQNLWLSCCVGLFMGTLCNKSLPVTLGNFPVCF